jgi:hypothetical protein
MFMNKIVHVLPHTFIDNCQCFDQPDVRDVTRMENTPPENDTYLERRSQYLGIDNFMMGFYDNRLLTSYVYSILTSRELLRFQSG